MASYRPPPLLGRLTALVLGPLYLMAWSIMLHQATDLPIMLTALIVLLGAGVIMGVLVAFGLKSLDGKESIRRFSIASLMLITVPLGIYLAAFRVVLTNLPFKSLTPGTMVLIIILCLGSMALSTLILLAFSEALAWIAVVALRWTRGATKKADSSEST